MKWMVAPSYATAKIKAIDESARKACIEEPCDRCGGLGLIIARVENGCPIPIPVDGGICYKCNGSGVYQKWVKAYTEEEMTKYLAAQEKIKIKKQEEKAKKEQDKLEKSEQNKLELLTKLGYDAENPLVWLVGGGNTYEIKDILKEKGCKFTPAFGWYNTHEFEVPEGYSLVTIKFNDVYQWIPSFKEFRLTENAKSIAEAAKLTLEPKSLSEYVGEVKDRLRDLKVKLTAVRSFDGIYGTNFIYTFKYDENVLVWMTSSYKEIEVGEDLLLTGTVKAHDEYRGVKQTKLSRCIIKKEA